MFFRSIENVHEKWGVPARFIATLLAHDLKHLEGQYPKQPDFRYEQIAGLLEFLVQHQIDPALAKRMLPHLWQHPKMDYESILITIDFRKISREDILAKLPFLVKKYRETRTSRDDNAGRRWIMGNLNKLATGNLPLSELNQHIQI